VVYDALPISAARSKALKNISTKACPHGLVRAAYCGQCLQDEGRFVALEDTNAELKSRLEEQAHLIDMLTSRADSTNDDVDSLGNAVVQLQQVVGRGYFRAGGPGGKA
jgi:hypothetical protein